MKSIASPALSTSTVPHQAMPGDMNRRNALLGAILVIAGLPAAQPTLPDRLVVFDGWVVKQSEVRRSQAPQQHAV